MSERALLARIADYLDAWVAVDVVMEDPALSAQDLQDAIATFAAARDAVTPDDVRAFRSYVERQR